VTEMWLSFLLMSKVVTMKKPIRHTFIWSFLFVFVHRPRISNTCMVAYFRNTLYIVIVRLSTLINLGGNIKWLKAVQYLWHINVNHTAFAHQPSSQPSIIVINTTKRHFRTLYWMIWALYFVLSRCHDLVLQDDGTSDAAKTILCAT